MVGVDTKEIITFFIDCTHGLARHPKMNAFSNKRAKQEREDIGILSESPSLLLD